MSEGWRPDILGEGFEQLTLPLPPDGASNEPAPSRPPHHRHPESAPEPEAPDLVATLVRSIPSSWQRLTGAWRDVDVLYIHGWSDYFFQTELADFFTDRGAHFYALDLRRYGRSLRPGQTPGDVHSLEDYDIEIDAALTEMGQDAVHHRRLVMIGHSTGGLTVTLWASRNPGRADGIVLNSPWLELQLGAVGRQALAPIVNARARIDPLGTQPVVDLGFYTRAQRELGVLPDAPPLWRPPQGFPTHPRWLAAVLEGHRRVAAGLDIGAPALVLLSARSTPPLTWSDEMTESDSVLVVDEIARSATRLGESVTIARIDGALHDVFISQPEARASAYRSLDVFVRVLLADL
ncbi:MULTISPECIES: alpha/beta hydrolase [unclassified Microbacterium]|uniref:alpha/beta hydrolase n=1 Tax=unclassified Microbacterium TaxID=2609290 RepID=UPI0037456906